MLLPVTMLSAIMVTIALLSPVIIGNLGHKAREISHQYLPSVDFLLQADRDLYKALVAERSIIFVDVNAPEFADLGKQHEENIQRAQGNVDKFRRVAGSLVRASLKDFDQRFTDWAATTRKIISERRDNGRIGRRSAIDLSFGQGGKQFVAVRSIIDELTKAVLANSEATVGRIDEAVAGSRTRMLGALGIGLSICVLVALLFPKMVTGPLLSILDRVEDIADGDGDLTVRVPVGSDDEIGQLGDAFNRCIGKLEAMVSEIVSSTSRLANAAEQMSGVSFASSDALGKQRLETEQAATAIGRPLRRFGGGGA